MNTTPQKTHTNFPGQPYVLNSNDSVIPVNVAPKGAAADWLHIRLRRPTRPELIEREAASTTTLKPKGGGESLVQTADWEANVALGKKTAVSVRGLKDDETETPAAQARLKAGWLEKAVRGFYAQHAKLRYDRSMISIDSDQNAPLFVEHEFGTGELPDYFIVWKFNQPDEITQADFRINNQKISTGSGGRRATSKLIIDLAVAERVFDEIFAGVEGAVIAVPDEKAENGFKLLTYTEEMREQFIAAIDPVVKRAALEPVMEWLEGNLSD